MNNKLTQNNFFLIIYGILLVTHLTGIYLTNTIFVTITKPMLVGSLIIYACFTSREKANYKSSVAIFRAALIASLLGDILLIPQGDNFFLLGLASFFVVHICYITLLFNVAQRKFYFNVINIVAISLITILIASLLTLLWSTMSYLRIPILIYSITIGLMALLAINSASSPVVSFDKATLLTSGSLLFIISDASLGLHKFLHLESVLSHIFVMLTYGLAQLLLVKGFLRTSNSNLPIFPKTI